MQYYRSDFTHAHQRERATSFGLLATVMLTQPRMQLAFFGVKRHCWLMVSLLFTMIPRAFSPKLYSSRSAPDCVCAWGYSISHAGQCTWLYWLHAIPASPFLQPTKNLLNISPAHYHLLRAQQTSHLCVIIQFIKTILHRISLRTDPQRTRLVSSCQMDFVPSIPLRPKWHA